MRTSKKKKDFFRGVKKYVIVSKWLQEDGNNVKQFFSDFNNL